MPERGASHVLDTWKCGGCTCQARGVVAQVSLVVVAAVRCCASERDWCGARGCELSAEPLESQDVLERFGGQANVVGESAAELPAAEVGMPGGVADGGAGLAEQLYCGEDHGAAPPRTTAGQPLTAAYALTP
jgi:hypothetical protein